MVQSLQPDVCGQYFYSGRAVSEVCGLWSEGSVVRGLSKVYNPTSVANTSTLVARGLWSEVCGLWSEGSVVRGLWSNPTSVASLQLQLQKQQEQQTHKQQHL